MGGRQAQREQVTAGELLHGAERAGTIGGIKAAPQAQAGKQVVVKPREPKQRICQTATAQKGARRNQQAEPHEPSRKRVLPAAKSTSQDPGKGGKREFPSS